MAGMRSSSILNDLIQSIESSDSQEISRLYLIRSQVKEFGFPFFPSEVGSSFNEVHCHFLHVFGRFGSEKGNFRIFAQSACKHCNSLENISEPVNDGVTEPEDVDSIFDNVLVLNFIHVLPHKLMMPSQGECLVVEFRPCANHIAFSAELFPSMRCIDVHLYGVVGVVLLVGEVHNHSLETVVGKSLHHNRFMIGSIPDVSDVPGSHSEKLRMLALRTLQELLLSLRIFGDVKDGLESSFIFRTIVQ